MHNMQRPSITYISAFLSSFDSPLQSIIFLACIAFKIHDISNTIDMFEDKVPSLLTGEHGETF
jgi:hypothetical protein